MFLRAQVWSDAGWTAVERVIRHRAGKPMVRVLTHTGLVDVTTDHSLLRADGSPATPREVNIGDGLLHFEAFPELPQALDAISQPWCADMMGCTFGEGRKRGHHAAGQAFEIAEASGGVGMLYMADLRVPMRILGAPVAVRGAFWAAVFNASEAEGVDRAWIDLTSQWSAATLMILAASLGYSVSVSSISSGYRVHATRTPPCDMVDLTEVVELVELPSDPEAYVYDLTTANHHFAAGVGKLVVHNTDSVMCILNLGEDKRHDMAAHFLAAERLAADISKTFPKPVELEFEKCYYPYLLFSKKRYAGLMFTNPATHDYVDVKGLQLVRRDNCPLVKDVSTAILDKIMYARDPDQAIHEARSCILRVLRHQEPLEKFIVSKSLRSDYKNNAQPHVYVAKKIFQRTGAKLPSGVRVPFVFVADAQNPDGLLAERAEDPEHVRANDLELDTLYYIHRQLESPIQALLELLVDDPVQAVFGDDAIKPLMAALHTQRDGEVKVAKRLRKNTTNKQHEITSFFQPKPSPK